MRLSPSKINTYYKCPREFYYKYIAKIPEKKKIHLFRGTLVHKILEQLFKYQFRSFSAWEKGEPEKWMTEQFETGWEEKIASKKIIFEGFLNSYVEETKGTNSKYVVVDELGNVVKSVK